VRIAVLSDIHGCAQTYETALNSARAASVDVTLILGDLLTYGVEPGRVVDLTLEAVQRDGAVVILGNHDQIYIDQQAGGSAYEQALPDWIRESVDWTREQIGALDLGSALDWERSWSQGGLYAAHANPYAYGDWTYLSTPLSMQTAADRLRERGFSAGIFGHSHRRRKFNHAGVEVVTVGSLGQPRDKDDLAASWSLITLQGGEIDIEDQPVTSDWNSHLAGIRATNLSETTKGRICGFFS